MSESNKPTIKYPVLTYLGIGVLIGLIIGGLIGIFYMLYYLDEMKEKGVYPRDDIIEYLNREINKEYEYEKGDEYFIPVYIKGVWHWNGSMISPPKCYGKMCPYNFTGVVIK